MEIPLSIAGQIVDACNDAEKIVIISHRGPDADSIGSNLALRELLESFGKEVSSVCIDCPPKELFFLRGVEKFQNSFNLDAVDLIICVDAGSTSQTHFLDVQPEIFQSQKPIINIDHHPSNNNYGKVNLVIADAASATLVMYHLFKTLGTAITNTMATSLLCGLYYDTGSFMHSNVCEEVYGAAAELMQLGANFPAIVKNMYQNRPISQLKAWGKILDNMKMTEGNVVVSGITQEELNVCSATQADTSGVIDYLSTVKDAAFATLLVEDGKGNIKGSFRTRKNDINLSEMAGQFGGGGHKKASGFHIEGNLKREVVWSIQPKETSS